MKGGQRLLEFVAIFLVPTLAWCVLAGLMGSRLGMTANETFVFAFCGGILVGTWSGTRLGKKWFGGR